VSLLPDRTITTDGPWKWSMVHGPMDHGPQTITTITTKWIPTPYPCGHLRLYDITGTKHSGETGPRESLRGPRPTLLIMCGILCGIMCSVMGCSTIVMCDVVQSSSRDPRPTLLNNTRRRTTSRRDPSKS
jgi:hypothetical protein